MERFPRRPEFDEWEKRINLGHANADVIWNICHEVIRESYRPDEHGHLEVLPLMRKKAEALYEFCAARGRLSAFENIMESMEKEAVYICTSCGRIPEDCECEDD